MATAEGGDISDWRLEKEPVPFLKPLAVPDPYGLGGTLSSLAWDSTGKIPLLFSQNQLLTKEKDEEALVALTLPPFSARP